MGRIPCRAVLDKMGLDINSTLCPRSEKEVESVEHALVQCEEVNKMWQEVARWWSIDLGSIGSLHDILEWNNDSGGNGRPKLWTEVTWAFIYLVWSHRNRIVFNQELRKLRDLFFEFQRKSFEWVARRIRRKKIEWNQWLAEPRCVLSSP